MVSLGNENLLDISPYKAVEMVRMGRRRQKCKKLLVLGYLNNGEDAEGVLLERKQICVNRCTCYSTEIS